MKLTEYLKTLSGTQIIRLSCKNGTNFLYIGKVEDLDLNYLEILRRGISLFRLEHSEDDKTIDKFKMWLDVPLNERNVVESSPGLIEPDHLRIRIEGCEGWIEYEPDMPELTLDSISQTGANRLVGAVYVAAANDLKKYIQKARSKGKPKEERNAAWGKVDYIKKFFRTDPYGQIKDPEAVIKQIERLARGR